MQKESCFLVALRASFVIPRALISSSALLGFLGFLWSLPHKNLKLSRGKYCSLQQNTPQSTTKLWYIHTNVLFHFLIFVFSCSKEMFYLVGAEDWESQYYSALFLKLALKESCFPPLSGWIMGVKIRRSASPVCCCQPSLYSFRYECAPAQPYFLSLLTHLVMACPPGPAAHPALAKYLHFPHLPLSLFKHLPFLPSALRPTDVSFCFFWSINFEYLLKILSPTPLSLWRILTPTLYVIWPWAISFW